MASVDNSSPNRVQQLAFARSFGRVFGALALGLCVWGATKAWPMWWVLAFAALALFGLSHFLPAGLVPVSRLWAKFGDVLGRIMNPIVLGIIFLVLFVPVGFIMKLIGRDALRRRLDPKASTYWITRAPAGPTPQSIKRPY